MSDVTLYACTPTEAVILENVLPWDPKAERVSILRVQGYLAHKKPHHPRTLQ